MRSHKDRGKTSGKIFRSAFIAWFSLLSWVALPSVSFAFYSGRHPGGGGRVYWGGSARPYGWGVPYAGAGPYYGGFRPNTGQLPYIRVGASEQPPRFQRARPPYQGGRFPQARPPYQGGRFQPARPPYPGAPGNGVGRAPYRGNQEDKLHLPAWIERHGNMPLADQERALQNEPGFKQLSPESQQRVLQSLRHIESLPPEQRERTLGYIESMERLSPERRQQVSASVRAIRTLPPDRKRMVTMALRDLIQYPPEERQAIMAQRQFQSRFSPQEQNILSNILAVEPYEPPIGPLPGPPPPFQPGR